MAEPPTQPESLHRIQESLLTEIRHLVAEARARAARTVNVEQTLLYWRIGERLHTETLGGDRADYGERILATLSQQLTQEFGRGFDYTALTRMVKFHQAFPDHRVVTELAQVLSWSHFRELLPLDQPLQRDFYAELCRVERWSVRTLRKKIDSMMYERTALSRQPEAVARQELDALREGDRVSPDLVLRDPYVLEFLGLKDRYLERDLEDAILREMEAFLMELGAGFAFLSRQYRIAVDGDDYYLDLLFYNRLLKRLVAIELKLGDFKPAYKGQMELYLRWLDKHERQAGEAPPLGIILCAGKRREQIELLELDQAGIHVAEYLTVLPPQEVLREKLHQALQQSRQRLNTPETDDD